MLSINIMEFIGYIGLLTLLTAYGFKEKLSPLNYSYLNLAGSFCMIGYAIYLESIPYLILNIIWSQVAGNDIRKEYKGKT